MVIAETWLNNQHSLISIKSTEHVIEYGRRPLLSRTGNTGSRVLDGIEPEAVGLWRLQRPVQLHHVHPEGQQTSIPSVRASCTDLAWAKVPSKGNAKVKINVQCIRRDVKERIVKRDLRPSLLVTLLTTFDVGIGKSILKLTRF